MKQFKLINQDNFNLQGMDLEVPEGIIAILEVERELRFLDPVNMSKRQSLAPKEMAQSLLLEGRTQLHKEESLDLALELMSKLLKQFLRIMVM